jgi:hypothetical protein
MWQSGLNLWRSHYPEQAVLLEGDEAGGVLRNLR